MSPVKVLELFSGVGGMHFAMDKAGIEAEVVAIDINDVANKSEIEVSSRSSDPISFTFTLSVYRHNFPSSVHLQKNICGLSPSNCKALRSIEVILMSPPCQPFTRQGKKMDLVSGHWTGKR